MSKVWQTVSQDLDPHPDTTTPELILNFKFENDLKMNNQKKCVFFKENWIYRGRLKKFFFPKALNLSSLGRPKLAQTKAHSRQGIHFG